MYTIKWYNINETTRYLHQIPNAYIFKNSIKYHETLKE